MKASDCHSEHGHVFLVSPVYWLTFDPPGDIGTSSLEAKPLSALLTAMILAGLKDPIIDPAACDLGSLGQDFLSRPIEDSIRSSETEVSSSLSGASREHVRRKTHRSFPSGF
jgi:hypothetical protein